nr:CPBP family intramembrane glutamic endopeptidase [Streptococcus dysgalactiae]
MTIYLFAPIYEEITFRLFVMRTFGNSLSGPLVVILSSILFSWSHLHGLSIIDFVVYFGIGLIFASLYHYTKIHLLFYWRAYRLE